MKGPGRPKEFISSEMGVGHFFSPVLKEGLQKMWLN
jgi:hypothetical protein